MGLRRFLLDAYGKSGAYGEIRPSIYSDREKNTLRFIARAFACRRIDTRKFYEGMSENYCRRSFCRFTLIEYHGDRPT
jgi:hypothetical protein